MRFGSEMHDDIGIGDELVDEFRVADIPGDELDLIEHRSEIVWIARICQFVDDRDLVVGVRLKRVVDEIGTDESGTAGN